MTGTFTALCTYTQTSFQIPHTTCTLTNSFTDGGISDALANTNIHNCDLYHMRLSLLLLGNKIVYCYWATGCQTFPRLIHLVIMRMILNNEQNATILLSGEMFNVVDGLASLLQMQESREKQEAQHALRLAVAAIKL
jgi:hypothetical protein